MFTQEWLKETISYSPETGEVFWLKPSKFKKELTGKLAGSISKQSGYFNIKLKSKTYRLHRVIWFYIYGVWPKDFIDHINHNRIDNRIENLRDVTNRQNCQNRSKENKSFYEIFKFRSF